MWALIDAWPSNKNTIYKPADLRIRTRLQLSGSSGPDPLFERASSVSSRAVDPSPKFLHIFYAFQAILIILENIETKKDYLKFLTPLFVIMVD